MNEAEFLAALTGHESDLKLAVAALEATAQPFCLIGGLAVNWYVEPVVTLEAHFAIAGAAGLTDRLRERGFEVEDFEHSTNARLPGSRLRIRITVNSRYAGFPSRSVRGLVLGVELPVACLEDLVQGKLWALGDLTRRASKRVKDRADLIRLCESHPRVITLIPSGLIPEVDELRSSSRDS